MKRPALVVRLFRHRRLLALCGESGLELAACKLRVMALPMRHWSGGPSFQAETLRLDRGADVERIRSVRQGIQIAARYVPWRSKCLDQGLAAQRMLARRGLDSTLYYGMAKDPARPQAVKWIAHAWVRCGDQWVVGHRESKGFTVVGAFVKHAAEAR